MLTEQIIEFELKRPGPRHHTCTVTPKTVRLCCLFFCLFFFFHAKTKIFKPTLRVIYNLPLKILLWAMYLASLSPWAKLLSKFNPKCKV